MLPVCPGPNSVLTGVCPKLDAMAKYDIIATVRITIGDGERKGGQNGHARMIQVFHHMMGNDTECGYGPVSRCEMGGDAYLALGKHQARLA